MSKVQRLAIAGAVAPGLRSKVASRRVHVVDAEGKTVRTISDAELAQAMLQRAGIEISTGAGGGADEEGRVVSTKKNLAPDPQDALRLALGDARLAALELGDFDTLQVLEAADGDPSFRVRLTAPTHARWAADLIDGGARGRPSRPMSGRELAVRAVFGLLRSRSSPLSDHVVERWAVDGREESDVAGLMRKLERSPPLKDGEDLVRAAATFLDWKKTGNFFSARDKREKRSGTSTG